MIPYKYITSWEDVPSALQAIRNQPRTGFDIETEGLDPRKGRICLAQFSAPSQNYIFNILKLGSIDFLFDILRDDKLIKIGQNLRFEQSWLWHHNKIELVNIFDTYKASNLCYNGKYDTRMNAKGELKKAPWKHGLYEIYRREINLVSDLKDCSVSNWSADELSEDQLLYAAEDVNYMENLFQIFAKKLKDLGMVKIAKLEFRATLAESMMELAGMPLDAVMWTELADTNQKRANSLKAELYELLPNPSKQLTMFDRVDFNLDSPAQLLKSLQQLQIPISDTNDWTLAEFSDTYPILEKLRDYREASKQVSSFGIEYLKNINPLTGRIHCNFYPFTGAGRYSSRSPNLQQLPRLKQFRECFRPPPGYKFIISDYSGAEMRAVANVAKDSTMITAFKNGEDLHKKTASFLLNKDIKSITKDEKQVGKSLNFSILYGAGPEKIKDFAKASYNVNMTLEEADKYRTAWFKLYPGIKQWHNKVFAESARSRGFTKTMLGRLRYLDPKEYSAFANTPVQGLNADAIKIAIGNLVRELWDKFNDNVELVNVIHDECILSCVDVPEILDSAKEVLTRCMVDAIQPLFGEVPAESESNICNSWADK